LILLRFRHAIIGGCIIQRQEASVMTVDPATGRYGQPAGLSFARTVDRSMVHRSAVSEVFITDVRRTGETRAVAAAQLPLAHGYYSDHVQDPLLYDPLLVLECCRQASICAAHVGEVPFSMAMLVSTFSLRLENLRMLAVGREPGELEIDGVFFPDVGKTGAVKGSSVEQTLFAGGTKVGTHRMAVRMLTQRGHDALRRFQRGAPAPTTADLAASTAPGQAAPQQAAPQQVGRVHPVNVVLSRVCVANGRVRAEVTPRFDNRALFDHEYDHLPAMTLIEAGRQIALVAAAAGAEAPARHVSAVKGEFRRFAELDEPLIVSAGLAAAVGSAVTASVRFCQRGQVIASAELAFAAPTDLA
jgi:2-oxo-3-(phosphooxy)propyl 3-oxoalkanoate synthase